MDPVIENRDLGRQGAVQYLELVPAGADMWWRVAGSGGRWPVLWCLVLPCRRWRAARGPAQGGPERRPGPGGGGGGRRGLGRWATATWARKLRVCGRAAS